MNNSPFIVVLGDGKLFGICFIAALLLVLLCFVFGRIYKGRVRRVCIVTKRLTHHRKRVFLSFKHNYGFIESDCYTVDLRYGGGRLVHTKYVSEQLFEKLTEGKSYNVTVKGGYILNIRRS